MRKKLQKIPESTWAKLIRIQEMKEAWNMMTIVNECMDLGANYLIKKLTKKDPTTKSEAGSSEIVDDEQLKRNINIAKTKVPYDED